MTKQNKDLQKKYVNQKIKQKIIDKYFNKNNN